MGRRLWGALLAIVALGASPTPALVSATSCGSSLEQAIDAATSGAILNLNGCSFTLDAPVELHRPITIDGGLVHSSATALIIMSSGVSIRGMTLIGPGHASYADHRGIDVRGPSPNSPVSNIRIERNVVRDWDGKGIRLENATAFVVANNSVIDVFYAGIETWSVAHGTITSNTIQRVYGDGNAYGIALTRAYGTLQDAPPSRYVTVAENTIEDVYHWEGIDTHGGQNLQIKGNVVRGCLYGINISASPAEPDGPDRYAPLDVSVTGNRIESGVSNGSRGYGIFFGGARVGFTDTPGDWTQLATGSIVGNLIVGHGSESNGDDASIQLYDTSRLVVAKNTIVNPSPVGMSVYYNNFGIAITDNTIRDAWSNDVPWRGAYGIFVHMDYNTGTIARNIFVKGTKRASFVLTRQVVVNHFAHNAIVLR